MRADEVRRHQRRVLDAMAMIGAGRLDEQPLEERTQRSTAASPIACTQIWSPAGVGGAHAREDLVLGERQEAARRAAVGEGLAHVGGAAPEGAVGEDLEAADAAARARGRGAASRGPRGPRRRSGRSGSRSSRRAASSSRSCMRERLEAARRRRPGPSSSVWRITPAEVMPQAARRANESGPSRAGARAPGAGHGAEQELRGGLEAGAGGRRRAGRARCGRPAGRRVDAVIPAAASARLLPTPLCPSCSITTSGRSGRRRRARRASGDAARRDPRPGAGGRPASRPVASRPPPRAARPGAPRSSARRAGRRSGRSRAGRSGAGGCR